MKRLTPPADFVKNLLLFGPEDIDVCSRDLPQIQPLPCQWVGCGPFGAAMHDDRHIPDRYSVLLVVLGGSGWKLVVDVQGETHSASASLNDLIFLDIHRPHALHHIAGKGDEPWVALAWNRCTRRSAERVRAMISAQLQIDALEAERVKEIEGWHK